MPAIDLCSKPPTRPMHCTWHIGVSHCEHSTTAFVVHNVQSHLARHVLAMEHGHQGVGNGAVEQDNDGSHGATDVVIQHQQLVVDVALVTVQMIHRMGLRVDAFAVVVLPLCANLVVHIQRPPRRRQPGQDGLELFLPVVELGCLPVLQAGDVHAVAQVASRCDHAAVATLLALY